MRRYEYRVNVKVMEDTYFSHTNTDFFKDDLERQKFNAKLVVYAENEEESLNMRKGFTDIRMWELIQDTNQ